MIDEKSPAESSLWDKILQKKVQYFIKNAPLTPINEIVADTEKEYLELKWTSLIDPDKFHLTIDQYLEFGDKFGPDLTALSRSRFDPKHFRKTSSDQTTKRHSSYGNFRKAMKGKMSNSEIIQKWKELPQDEKDKYKIMNEENS